MIEFGGPIPWTGRLATPEDVVTLAKHAEHLGFAWVDVGEHLFYPKHPRSTHPTGALPVNPDENQLDSLVLLTWVAAHTTTLRIETAMYLLALRDPFVTAKAVATLDYMSGGRFTLGVSAGWMEDEFEVLNIDFHQRGALADEYLAILRALFNGDDQFEGTHYSFKELWFVPQPVQKPFPIIVGGGASESVLRRVVRYAQGWWPWLLPPTEITLGLERLAKLMDEVDRDPTELTIREYIIVNRDPTNGPVTTKDEVLGMLKPLIDVGVNGVSVQFGEMGGAINRAPTLGLIVDSAGWFADEIMPEVSDVSARG